jgi:hypothetical protein
MFTTSVTSIKACVYASVWEDMAFTAGLADQRWTLDELFLYKTPPRPCLKKQGRGRMSNHFKRCMLCYGF